MQISDKDVVRFTEGDCHIFARAMNKLTGWQICGFADRDGQIDAHAFVKRPDGALVDIEGIHPDPNAYKRAWKATKIQEFTWDNVLKDWGPAWFGSHSYRRAKQLAPIIAAQAGYGTIDR